MKMQNAVTVDVNPEADREIEFVQQEDDNENEEDEEGLMKAMARASGDRLVATTEKTKRFACLRSSRTRYSKRRRKREWQLSLVYSPDGRCLI